ncbi:MAG: hypothetical protein ABI830_09890 [Pseudolabrys sp.]
MITQTENAISDHHSAVSWKAIAAGATASAALSLVMVAFGVGVGFSVVSPWSDQGVSATTFTIAAGIYLVVMAMIPNTIGGYLAGRLRSQWSGVNEHERYFRDSAHGFLVWAFATVVIAAVLGGAVTHLLNGAAAGVAPAASVAAQNGPTDIYVDTLMRGNPASNRAASASPAPATANQQATSPTAEGQTTPALSGGQIAAPAQRNAGPVNRGEISRILSPALRKGGTVSDADRGYLAGVVAARTGIPPAEAEQRVTQVITQAKATADAARKSIATFSLWLVASMLAGALAASFAAIEGGSLRNREWYVTDASRTRVVAAE